MTRLAFLLDQDSCVGCHACTVACKSEHEVPLGVNRTWLKYVEKGSFPDTRRHFAVLRCNHCQDAPCVEICPTTALFHRDNGIVDFDTSLCIGCKSCMNACPYDALYLNPETHVAEKCNFCAHRVDVGLEPSCVVVCPPQAIVVGDLDDPTSKVSRMIAREEVAVRAPEQGTRPKLFYRGADEAALDPMQTRIAEDGMIWAETTPAHPTLRPEMQTPAAVDDATVRTAYTTEHPTPWKGMVSAYLVAKAVAAGALLIGALLVLLGHADEQVAVGLVPSGIALVFTALTGALLVADLKRPERFLYILTKGNPRSWLVRGAWILAAYAAVSALWFLGGLLDSPGMLQGLAIPAAILAAATAGYTAWLFAQCEGRDLWQTPLLLPILLAQAVVAGAAAMLVADLFIDLPSADAVRWSLLAGLGTLLVLVFAESSAHGTANVEAAVAAMLRGRYAARFWVGGMLVGIAVPAVLVILALVGVGGASVLSAIAGVTAVAGMYAYEDAFVRAGQSVPLS